MYHATHRHLPDGPKNGYDFGLWPFFVLEDLVNKRCTWDTEWSLRRRRLQNTWGSGVVLHTSYSGMGGPENALRMLGVAADKMGLDIVKGAKIGFGAWSDAYGSWHRHRPPDLGSGDLTHNNSGPPWLVTWRACDNSDIAQKVLVGEYSRPGVLEHCVPELLQMLNWRCRREIVKLRPTEDLPKEQKALAYTKQAQFLQKQSWCMDRTTRSPCLIHPGRLCPIAWKDPPLTQPSERPLTVSVSGPMCTPWSSAGGRDGLANPATEAWQIYLQEQKDLNFDLSFLENSPRLPQYLLPDALPNHRVLGIIFGPEALKQ